VDWNLLCVTIFWSCLALVSYTYLGYPILVWGASRVFNRLADLQAGDDADAPPVSVLIAAYNEEAVIEDRLRNALAMDYPAEKLEIMVGSDGSTDRTAEIVRGYADSRVRLQDFSRRRGKAAVLNSSVPELKGEILLFSDANTQVDSAAVRKLVRWFPDPRVGAVCGRLVLTDPLTGKNVDSLYWKYETFLKQCEGRLGALLGANGAIYAIRKAAFTPIPDETILDDFTIPLLAKLRTGCMIVYDSEAVAREETPPELGMEFLRRSRIGAGGFQSLGLVWRLLHPRWGWTAWALVSHKILRWLCPFFLLGMLASNLVLCARPFFQIAFVAQLLFYLVSWAMAVIPIRFRFLRPLRLTTMFTCMNLALLAGFGKWLLASQKGAWQRTVRPAENAGGRVR
jgi:cellulose synthase/poly-beta-1,6-N-acetylglucosamine synthase-like glycosyltransferase